MATAAMFVALGGTSYAVTKLPKGAVGNRELRQDAVTSEKVKDGTLSAADLAPGALIAGPRGPRGTDGPSGPPGSNGPKGDTGGRGPSDLWTATHGGVSLPPQANVHVQVAKVSGLPGGSYLLTGSAHLSNWDHPGAIGACAVVINGSEVGRGVTVIGNGAGSARVADVTPVGWATVGNASTAVLECWIDQAVATGASAINARLSALRVETLH